MGGRRSSFLPYMISRCCYASEKKEALYKIINIAQPLARLVVTGDWKN
jgi:hypothetical protein